MNKLARNIVQGWIRKMSKMSKMSHIDIPIVLVRICILYYDEKEEFIDNENIKLTADFKVARFETNCINLECGAFGKNVIPSMVNVKCKWDLKIKHVVNNLGGFLAIGVSTSNTKQQSIRHHKYGRYCYSKKGCKSTHCGTLCWIWQGKHYTTNDKVSVELDLASNYIKFYVNDVDQGVSYEKDEILKGNNVCYRLYIAGSKNAEIEIVGFVSE